MQILFEKKIYNHKITIEIPTNYQNDAKNTNSWGW
jgi:hypothetical protein